MDEGETSKMMRGGLTPEQCREYERRMEMKTKRKMVEEEVFRGPTAEQ